MNFLPSAWRLGANWNGARAFTATSGPGISLMSEFIGLAYFFRNSTRIVQHTAGRGRPQACRHERNSLMFSPAPMPVTVTPNMFCYFRLIPASVLHLVQMHLIWAERLQTPVFVMSDLDNGMNDWVIDEFTWDDERRADRGQGT